MLLGRHTGRYVARTWAKLDRSTGRIDPRLTSETFEVPVAPCPSRAENAPGLWMQRLVKFGFVASFLLCLSPSPMEFDGV